MSHDRAFTRAASAPAIAFLAALALAPTARAQRVLPPARPAPELPRPGQPAPPPPPPLPAPVIAPIDPVELEALRPLIPLGAVVIARNFGSGSDARSTVYVRIHAPRETVLHVIATPEEYPAFVPALSGTEVISRSERRGAFRFHASAVLFDVTATATVNTVNDHRVDFSIDHSDVGPAGARWELFSEGANETTVALTIWVDPAHADWAVRQLAGDAGFAALGAGMTAETVLALAVKRRAEILTGAPLPLRPDHALAPRTEPEAPPPGPWLALTHTTNIAIIRLDDQSRLVSVTAVGTALRTAEPMTERLLAPEQYGTGWPFMHDTTVLDRRTDAVRFRLRLSTPLAGHQGEWRATRESNGLGVRVEGLSGDFAGEQQRWDFVPFERGAYIVYTAGSELPHATWTQRTLMETETFSAAGAAAYWNIMMIRSAFAGVPETFPYQP